MSRSLLPKASSCKKKNNNNTIKIQKLNIFLGQQDSTVQATVRRYISSSPSKAKDKFHNKVLNIKENIIRGHSKIT